MKTNIKRRGTNASKEINALREERAARELQETGRPVAAIAADVGYDDPVVFLRAFKRWTGMTPSQYRKEHRSAL